MHSNFILYFFFKSFALISFLFSTPLLLNGLGSNEFGIWSTLSSFVSWILVLDFGIGNYLRNKISEFEVQGQSELIKEHLICSSRLIFKVAMIICLVLGSASFFINWEKLLGVISGGESILFSVLFIIFFSSFSFISNLVYFYFYGIQKSHIVAFLQTSCHIIFIFVSYLLYKTDLMTLETIALAFGSSMVVPGLIASIYVINDLGLWGRINKASEMDGKNYLTVGSKFFFIQITGLILFSTDKIILSNVFGPDTVTEYEVLFKVFSVALLAQSIVNTPSWGKYSQDFFSENISSVRNLIKKHLILFFLLQLMTIVIAINVNRILNLWLDIEVDNGLLVLSMCLFVGVMIWNNVYAIFLNATNNIDLTFKICLVVILVNIPLSYFLAQTEFKESGIVIGTIICLLPAAILTPIQTFKILKKYA